MYKRQPLELLDEEEIENELVLGIELETQDISKLQKLVEEFKSVISSMKKGDVYKRQACEILKMISENPNISIDDLRIALDVTDRTIARYISELKDKGIIEQKGPDNGGCLLYTSRCV